MISGAALKTQKGENSGDSLFLNAASVRSYDIYSSTRAHVRAPGNPPGAGISRKVRLVITGASKRSENKPKNKQTAFLSRYVSITASRNLEGFLAPYFPVRRRAYVAKLATSFRR